MIFVCELICRGVDHERLNSGFLFALGLAFPGQGVRFYADESHIRAAKATISRDKLSIQGLECTPVKLPGLLGFHGVRSYAKLMGRVLREARAAGTDRIFLLSFNSELLVAIRKLRRGPEFAGFKFAFVLHGAFERIAAHDRKTSAVVLPEGSLPRDPIAERLRRLLALGVWSWAARTVIRNLLAFPFVRKVLGLDRFDMFRAMELSSPGHFRYISLSEHATRNASKYIDRDRIPLFTVGMPIAFNPPRAPPRNSFAKFGVYGNVDSLMLYNVAKAVADRKPNRLYEIRVISKNRFGLEGLPGVTFPMKPGRRLERSDMEDCALDLDLFLLLFDANKYCLTCSGVVYEALSLIKPVIHFDNDCVDQFNSEVAPIGYRCSGFETYVDTIVDIINNYERHAEAFERFRAGLLAQRRIFAIENSVSALRASFQW